MYEEGRREGGRRRGDGIQLMIKILFFLIVALILSIGRSNSIEWLAIARKPDAHWNRTSDCFPWQSSSSSSAVDGLSGPQRRICRRTLDLMPAVQSAAQLTVAVCQGLFHNSRWNCSSILLAPDFTPDLTQGSREQGAVYALAAAALAHSVAKTCSSSQAPTKCSCGPLPADLPRSDFRWGGCSDNLRYGLAFSRIFTDHHKASRASSKKSIMNIHNSNVGRKILAGSLSTQCKCHGVSGSCSIKTCWKALPELRTVGSTLLHRYYVAVEVKRSRRTGTNDSNFESTSGGSYGDDTLIFYNKSPDYCLPDKSLGSLGTQDRECVRNDTGSIGCQSMCCGRGYRSQTIERSYRCECKYYWCCYVKCKLCTTTVEINRCR